MNPVLDLRVGEFVEVRSEEEILRTLDSRGTLDLLPFMPEMLQFCGKRFRVFKRAEKACDTIEWGRLRRMKDAVHLEGLRCNGQAHDGCQAGCLIYWKEAWLKRVADPSNGSAPVESVETSGSRDVESIADCTSEMLVENTRRQDDSGEEIFTCQATELRRATTSTIPWWEPGQYVRDVRSGNARVGHVIRGLVVGLFNKFQEANVRFLSQRPLIHGGRRYPFVEGKSTGQPPSGSLNLQPGELVEVKSKEEIFATLDERDYTRGLRYDSEMLKYSRRRGRVLYRVEKFIDEKTGKMRSINSDCIVIGGFVCTGDYHRSCPRSVYAWWRESWLKRVE
jgi:hypothetical protein